MARFYETAKTELDNARVELEALNTISNEEACYIYNVDSKSEIENLLKEEIESLLNEVAYSTPEIYEPEFNY